MEKKDTVVRGVDVQLMLMRSVTCSTEACDAGGRGERPRLATENGYP